MPQPDDSFELIDNTEDRLHHPTYVKDFGPYLWTRIVGYPNLVELLYLAEGFPSVRVVKEHVAGQRIRALSAIPRGWKARFTEGQNSEWTKCNTEQIKNASLGKPLRFDKACIAIKTLELAFAGTSSDILKGFDVYEFLKLRPSVFVFRNLDNQSRAILADKNLNAEQQAVRDALMRALTPDDGHNADLNRDGVGVDFLAKIADGFGITFQNATTIANYLASISVPRPEIEPLDGRADQGTMKKRKQCNLLEDAFVSLDAEKLRQLRTLAPMGNGNGRADEQK